MKVRAFVLCMALAALGVSADDAVGAVRRAPSGPPLTSPTGASAGTSTEASLTQPLSGTGDPLVENGLGSPVCQGG